MRKPQEGEIIRILDPEASLGYAATDDDAVRVLNVYDHYNFDQPGGDWGDDGELAWQQEDHDAETGKIGEWYIIGELVTLDEDSGEAVTKHEGETFSLASYEVQVD